MSRAAVSLRSAVTGCDPSVTRSPSLNWLAMRRKSLERASDVALIAVLHFHVGVEDLHTRRYGLAQTLAQREPACHAARRARRAGAKLLRAVGQSWGKMRNRMEVHRWNVQRTG